MSSHEPDPFAHHPPPDDATVARHEEVRAAVRDCYDRLDAVVPFTPERTACYERLREAMMWANAAVALASSPTNRD